MLDFGFIRDNWLFIAAGVGQTLGIAILAFLLAILIGMAVARGLRSASLPVRALSGFYAWLVDSVPLLLQIFFIFMALPQLGIYLPGTWSAVLVLALNYGPKMCKVFFAGFAAQETRVSLIPPLTEALGGILKDSTLISVTGFLHDVMWRAQKVGRTGFHWLEAFIMAALIYLILLTLISLGGKALDRITTSGPRTQVSA